jgi:hypothetical protein
MDAKTMREIEEAAKRFQKTYEKSGRLGRLLLNLRSFWLTLNLAAPWLMPPIVACVVFFAALFIGSYSKFYREHTQLMVWVCLGIAAYVAWPMFKKNMLRYEFFEDANKEKEKKS